MKNLAPWISIPAIDFQRAVEFYNRVLEIELQVVDCGEEKMACFPSGEGAVALTPGFKPSQDGVLVSLNVGTDLEAAMDRVMQSGGKIVLPKTKIEAEGRGYFTLFIDCEGNKLGLYTDN